MTEEPGSAAPADRPPPGSWPTLGWTGVLFLSWFLLQWLAALPLLFVGSGLPPAGLTAALALTLATPPAAAALLVLARRLGLDLRADLGLRPPTWRQGLLWTGATAVVAVAGEAARLALGEPLVPPFMVDLYASAVWLPLFWVAFVGMAPLFEELLFRGFLLPGLASSPRLGTSGAVVGSAVLWALVHGQYGWTDKAVVLALGLVLGAARARTGSTLLALGLHALINLAAVLQTAGLAASG